MKVTLEWSGGAEALFGNVRKREVELESQTKSGKEWTVRELLKWLYEDSGYLTQKPELFFCEDSVRPGILVLVNDADWELLGHLDYNLQEDDNIVFISTLHGG